MRSKGTGCQGRGPRPRSSSRSSGDFCCHFDILNKATGALPNVWAPPWHPEPMPFLLMCLLGWLISFQESGRLKRNLGNLETFPGAGRHGLKDVALGSRWLGGGKTASELCLGVSFLEAAMGENEILRYRGHLALASTQVGWDAVVLLFAGLYIPGELSSPVELSSFVPICQDLVMQSSGAAWGSARASPCHPLPTPFLVLD